MSDAIELLNDLDVTSVSEEGHIVIDSDRYITVPDELKRIAVQYDHNIETVTFDCPRYWDDHDMSTMNVYINYLRSDNSPGVYAADNVRVDDDDSSIMHFDWTVSKYVTSASGKITFLVCIKSVGEDGEEQNHWNSELCDECYVSAGLEVNTGDYSSASTDVIEQWRAQITGIVNELLEMRESGQLKDGTGIASVEQTASSTEDNGENIITITLTDGTTSEFTVFNGSSGVDGNNGITSLPIANALDRAPDDYIAAGDDLPTVSVRNDSNNTPHVGKGAQIIFIQRSGYSNTTTSPTLSLNGGEAIPIRVRASQNQGDYDSNPEATMEVPIGALMVGVPYTMTFCGKYWLIDSYIAANYGATDTYTKDEIDALITNQVEAELEKIANITF